MTVNHDRGYVATERLADLSISELHYRRMFEAAQDGILILDVQSGKIQDVNPYFLTLLGYAKSELIGKTPWEIDATVDKAQAVVAFADLKKTSYVRYENLPLKAKNGEFVRVALIASVYRVGSDPKVHCSIRDITVSGRTERQLLTSQIRSRRSNWTVLAYAQAALALFHATTPHDLITDVCRVIAQQAPFCLCWVGMVEHDTGKTVRVAAHSGSAKAYAEGIAVSWSEATAWGLGPTGQCIRSGKTVLISDTLTNPTFEPWRERANHYDIRCCIAVPIVGEEQVVGALMVYAKIPDAFAENEVRLFENLAKEIDYGLRAIARSQQLQDEIKEREVAQKQLFASLESTIGAMSKTLEFRDPYTAGHQKRVADLAVAIGRELGLDEDRLRGIHLGCLVHDIGKVAIPAEILTKPNKLTELEMMMVREHAQTGFEILKGIPFVWPIAQMAYQHHERLDGSGYPQGLKGEQIILEARILAVADTIESMATHRPYRVAVGLDAALQIIQAGKGVLFDTAVVEACLRIFQQKRYQLPAA